MRRLGGTDTRARIAGTEAGATRSRLRRLAVLLALVCPLAGCAGAPANFMVGGAETGAAPRSEAAPAPGPGNAAGSPTANVTFAVEPDKTAVASWSGPPR